MPAPNKNPYLQTLNATITNEWMGGLSDWLTNKRSKRHYNGLQMKWLGHFIMAQLKSVGLIFLPNKMSRQATINERNNNMDVTELSILYAEYMLKCLKRQQILGNCHELKCLIVYLVYCRPIKSIFIFISISSHLFGHWCEWKWKKMGGRAGVSRMVEQKSAGN